MKYFLLSFLCISMSAQEKTSPTNQSEELGAVSWYRNYEEVVLLAKKENKSVLILFQEVPGCATCRNYGHNVLSHPLMVEAIEHLFVPLAIYNNKGGEDAKILKQFNEPTWNNPVVRIVDAEGQNLVERVAGNYSSIGLYEAMEMALQKTNQPVPEFMRLFGEEIFADQKSRTKETYFKMYCFWSGEGHLGQKEGVLSTEAGFMGGHEVVKVEFDEAKISEKELANYAEKGNCEPIKKDGTYRTDKDPQYYLKQTNYRYLPLTDLQKTKINSAIGHKESPEKYLSPSQKMWLEQINKSNKNQVLYTEDFCEAWKKIDK